MSSPSPVSSTFSLVPAVPPPEEALEAPPPEAPAPPVTPVQSESALTGSPLQSHFSLVSLTEAQAASQEPLCTEMVWATHPHAHLPPASPMLAFSVPPVQMPPGCGVAVPIHDSDSDTESAVSNATVVVGFAPEGLVSPPPEPPEPMGVQLLGFLSARSEPPEPPVDTQPPAIAAGQQPPALPVATDSTSSWADIIDTVFSLPTTPPATPPVAQDSPPPAAKRRPQAKQPAPAAGGAAPWGHGPPGAGANIGFGGADQPSWTPPHRTDQLAGYKLMVGAVPPAHLVNVAASVVRGGGEFLSKQKFKNKRFIISPVRLDIFGWSRALGTKWPSRHKVDIK